MRTIASLVDTITGVSRRVAGVVIVAAVGVIVAALLLGSPALLQATPGGCVGDCNGDRMVTVDEIVTLVNIGLGTRSVDGCAAGDDDGDGAVTVDEIVRAVTRALRGCVDACSAGPLSNDLPLSVVGDTSGSPAAAGSSCGGRAREAVFSFTAPRTATYVFDSAGSSFDTVLYVRAGDCTGEEIACNDDTGDLLTSAIQVELEAGATVAVFVDGFSESFDEGEFILNVTGLFFAGCRGDGERDLDAGLRYLRGGYLQLANEAFACAIASGNQAARLFRAVTGVVSKTVDDPALVSLAKRAGADVFGDSGDICNFDLHLDPNAIPAEAPTGAEIIDTLGVVLLPEIEAALSSLEAIAAGTTIAFTPRQLPACLMECVRAECTLRLLGLQRQFPSIVLGDSPVEIDRGDILLLRALLESSTAVLETAAGYDFNVGLRALLEDSTEAIVDAHPQLLALRMTAALLDARDSLDAAFDLVVRGLDAVRGEVDDQSDDLITLEPKDDMVVDAISDGLQALRGALQRETSIPIDVVTGRPVVAPMGELMPERLDLSLLFSGHFGPTRPLRALLPRRDEFGKFDFSDVPDPTFGGVAPQMTQRKIDDFFSGGPQCAACEVDSECNAFGFGDYGCFSCFDNCTGQVRRCGRTSDFTVCSDGTF